MKKLRYQEISGPETLFQPGSRGGVLVNLKGITSKRAMDIAEYETLVSAQTQYYRQLTSKTRFTAKLLCEMHRDWLGELYAWAGQYRTVNLEKGGFVWPPASMVSVNMVGLDRDILSVQTPCRPVPVEKVAQAMARVHAEFLLVHPFREGNGRLARWLADLMATQAGFPVPDYALSGRGSLLRKERYLGAVRQGYRRDYEPLAVFFVEAIRRAGGSTPRRR